MRPTTECIRLPLGEIYPDPDRPLRRMARERLDELARSMATVGQIHPVIVCREGLRWLMVCGERRLEAARRLGWERILARPIPYAPPAIRAVIRAAENIHSGTFSLIEKADALLSVTETGTPLQAVADALGRKKGWVEALLSMARDPIARALLDADRIASVEAWEEFMRLPSASRRRLLQSDSPITHERCQRETGRGWRKRSRPRPKRHERVQEPRA